MLRDAVVILKLFMLHLRGGDAASRLCGARHGKWKERSGSYGTSRRCKLSAAPRASNHENAAQGDPAVCTHCCLRSAMGNATLKGLGPVSALGGSEEMSRHPAKATRQHVANGSSAAVSSFELNEVQRFPQEGLANGTMKEEKWDSRDTLFARTDADVDPLLYLVPMAGGRLL